MTTIVGNLSVGAGVKSVVGGMKHPTGQTKPSNFLEKDQFLADIFNPKMSKDSSRVPTAEEFFTDGYAIAPAKLTRVKSVKSFLPTKEDTREFLVSRFGSARAQELMKQYPHSEIARIKFYG